MNSFMMASDEAQRAIARIGARTIADAERARIDFGQRLLEDQRKAAEMRAQLVTNWQASVSIVGRQVFDENQQAMAATFAQRSAASIVAEFGRRIIADITYQGDIKQ